MTAMNDNDSLDIDIQIESAHDFIPTPKDLIKWVTLALETDEAEVTVRIVDEEESASLNQEYRNKKGATNVLSFPFISNFDSTLHGDIIVCAPIVANEAKEQNKPLIDHWAHLVIHGVLHLQGYDHIKDEDANKMEQKEISLLSVLNIPNPYE